MKESLNLDLIKTIKAQSSLIKQQSKMIKAFETKNTNVFNKDKWTFMQAFNIRCKEKGLMAYLKDVLNTIDAPTWKLLTPMAMERFVEYLGVTTTKRTGKAIEPTTQNLYISNLRMLIKWGNTPVNDVMDILKEKKVSPRKKIWLHPDELEKIYSYSYTKKEASTWKMFLICCLTGCRIIDAPNINESNLDGETLRYVPIKTRNTECYVHLRKEQIAVLKALLYVGGTESSNEELRNILHNCGITRTFDIGTYQSTKIVNVADVVHFHTARHTFATIKYRCSGWSEREIAIAVGHKDFKQTWNNYVCDKSPVTQKDKEMKGLFV